MTHSQVPCWTQIGSKLIKQRNCLELKACSQLSTLKGVEGRVEVQGWNQEEGQVLVTYSNMYQPNQQVGQFISWNTFGARRSHERPQTHKTHHGPNSREATTFPHIVFFALLRNTYIRMAFCPGTPKESRNCPGLDSLGFASSQLLAQSSNRDEV